MISFLLFGIDLSLFSVDMMKKKNSNETI